MPPFHLKVNSAPPETSNRPDPESASGKGSLTALEGVVLILHPAGLQVRFREGQPARGHSQGQRHAEIRTLLAPDSRFSFSSTDSFDISHTQKDIPDACFLVIVFKTGSLVV